MGFADFFSDLYASVVPQDMMAEAPAEATNADSSSEDQGSGKSTTAQQSGSAGTRGGVSSSGVPHAGTDEESDEEAEINKADAKGGDDEGAKGHVAGSGGDDEEEEDEDEDEPQDIQPKLEEECAESKQCAPAKHHYDECVERVTKKQEENDGKSDEDCVEEFFHLAHCATQCAAPKLFAQLK